MKRKNYLICLLTAIILLPIGVQAKDKKKGKKNIPMTEIQTTGTQDRAIWVKLLWKISYPVIHNLAEGTLHYTRICPLRPVAVKQQATKT